MRSRPVPTVLGPNTPAISDSSTGASLHQRPPGTLLTQRGRPLTEAKGAVAPFSSGSNVPRLTILRRGRDVSVPDQMATACENDSSHACSHCAQPRRGRRHPISIQYIGSRRPGTLQERSCQMPWSVAFLSVASRTGARECGLLIRRFWVRIPGGAPGLLPPEQGCHPMPIQYKLGERGYAAPS